MKAVILAGGRGTRLAPYTTVLPKPLMPIGDRPVLELLLRQVAKAGFTDVTLAVGHLAELIMAFCGDGSKFGVRIRYSKEEEPLGTAGPLALVQGLDATFLVLNGDLLTDLDLGQFLAAHRRSGAVATVAMSRRTVPIALGVLEMDGDGLIRNYIEKPTHEYLASMGLYLFEPEVLSHIPRNARFDLPDLVKRLIAADRPVSGHLHPGLWLDIGTPADYEQALAERERLGI